MVGDKFISVGFNFNLREVLQWMYSLSVTI